MIIYAKKRCPYTFSVIYKLHELGIDFETRYLENEKHKRELVDRAGKNQAPYMVDEQSNTEMYESGNILEYLHKTYNN